MKKVLSFLLCAVLLGALVGCSGGGDAPPAVVPQPDSRPPASSSVPADESEIDDFDFDTLLATLKSYIDDEDYIGIAQFMYEDESYAEARSRINSGYGAAWTGDIVDDDKPVGDGFGLFIYTRFADMGFTDTFAYLYDGTCENGLPNGEGTSYRFRMVPDDTDEDIVYYYIDIFTGTFEDGVVNGKGKYTESILTSNNGSITGPSAVYTGNFVDGLLDGAFTIAVDNRDDKDYPDIMTAKATFNEGVAQPVDTDDLGSTTVQGYTYWVCEDVTPPYARNTTEDHLFTCFGQFDSSGMA